jgi:hypothetical protein
MPPAPATMPQSALLSRLHRTLVRAAAASLLAGAPLAFTACAAARPAARAESTPALPAQLSDHEFWGLVSDMSEPGGYFRIEDNYTSNEAEVGQLHSALRAGGIAGDVYLGVGPEQNFTYIAAIRPRLAFIVDIRRQAVVQHLMYKAIFELAADRAAFISLLFARPRPAGVAADTPIAALWERYAVVPADSMAARANHARLLQRLTGTHGFTLTTEERAQLASVYDAFVRYGPDITTRGTRGGFGSNRGFAELTGFALDSTGRPQSFLSTDANYQLVRTLHQKNLIVPLSGDFAGPKTIRAIGAYLAPRRATVRAFYVSNVEQYLFQDGKDEAFYANVATLPLDSTSVFIRPYSLRRGGRGGPTRSLCPIARFLQAADSGRVATNEEALTCAP